MVVDVHEGMPPVSGHSAAALAAGPVQVHDAPADVAEEGSDVVGSVHAAAARVVEQGALVRARIAEVVSAANELGAAHAALHGAAANSDSQGAPEGGAAHQKDALSAAGMAVMKNLVALRADIRNLHVGAADTVAMLDPIRKAAEKKRQDAENLFYRREMLKRDILLQRSFVSEALANVELMSIDEIEEAKKASSQSHSGSAAVLARSVSGQRTDIDGASPSGLDIHQADLQAVKAEKSLAISGDISRANGNGMLSGLDNTAPTGEGRSVVDEEALDLAASRAKEEHDHHVMLARLEYEIRERKRLASVVKETKLTHMQRKIRNSNQKLFLSRLPKRIKEVTDAVKPLQSFFSGESSSNALLPVEESVLLRKLPLPLYILAREAVAARGAFEKSVAVHILNVDDDTSGGTSMPSVPKSLGGEAGSQGDSAGVDTRQKQQSLSLNRRVSSGCGIDSRSRLQSGEVLPPNLDQETDDGTQETLESLHATDSQIVRIDLLHNDDPRSVSDLRDSSTRKRPRESAGNGEVGNSSNSSERGPLLSLTFRYHPKLNVVSVSCRQSYRGTPFGTDDLCMLYPYDCGRESPNPSNSYLLGGRFKFDAGKVPGHGRPYVWANILCGLHFPGCIPWDGLTQSGTVVPDDVKSWPERAASFPTHVRFSDIVSTIRERIQSRLLVQSQLNAFSRFDIPVSWESAGLKRRPRSRLTLFARAAPSFETKGAGLSEVSSEEFVEVWEFGVDHPDGLRVGGVAALQPNYPVGSVVFRVQSSAAGTLSESDVREMEEAVNSAVELRNDGGGVYVVSSTAEDGYYAPTPLALRSEVAEHSPGLASSGQAGRGAGSAVCVPNGVGVVSGAGARATDGGVSEEAGCHNLEVSVRVWRLLECVDKAASDIQLRIELGSRPVAEAKMTAAREALPRTDVEAPMEARKTSAPVHKRSRIADLIE